MPPQHPPAASPWLKRFAISAVAAALIANRALAALEATMLATSPAKCTTTTALATASSLQRG